MFHHPAWAVGSYSSGHQPGELTKSKSTQPRSETYCVTLYNTSGCSLTCSNSRHPLRNCVLAVAAFASFATKAYYVDLFAKSSDAENQKIKSFARIAYCTYSTSTVDTKLEFKYVQDT